MKAFSFLRLWSGIVFLTFSGILLAQEHTLEGVVKDAETGEEVIGASVLEQGTLNGTITDFDGKFQLTVSSPDVVVEVSSVGYETRIVPVENQTYIDVSLSLKLTELDEIVVIGYGSQKKKVVTGAISSVSSDEITSAPTLRIDQAMQGRTAGVQVTNLSGQPGEAPTVRIRGAGTTGNPEPLYIVDGMAVGGIDYLNPGDIESIDVLKDAASAAIYGARAANGVVLITTKSGTQGTMNVTYSGYYGIQNVAKTIDMLDADQYRELMNDGARNSGLTEPFDMNEIATQNTNWQDYLFEENAPMSNHELSVTGGRDGTSYASSISYFAQEGIIGGDKSKFERLTGRLNTRSQVNDYISYGSNMAYSHIIRRGISSNGSFNSAYSSALNLDPLTPVYEDDPAILETYPYADEPVVEDDEGRVYGISNYIGAEIVNPLALLETQTAETRVDKLVGNVFAQLEPIKGLQFKTSLGIDLAYVLNDSYRPLFYLNGAQLNDDKTSVSKGIQRYFTWQWENTMSYSKTVDDHNFSFLAGMTASKNNYEDLSGFNAKVPITDPDHVYLNMATDTVWTASGGAYHSSLLSAFGRVTYDFKDKYSFTGILRRDGSSKFGSNSRYGIFPSIGVAWVLSDEDFIPELGPINFLKLRASYGINGNQEIGNYQFISVMDQSRGYIFSSGRKVGASPAYIENADIRWEESRQFDIAMDLRGFESRLVATIDYYQKTTEGLLERIPIPAHVGNDPPFANVGSVRNRGVELSVNWRHFVNELRYSVGINGSYNKNEMINIGNQEGVLPGATWAVAGMVTRTEIGLPIAYFYGYKTDGIFQNETEIFQHIGSTGDLLQPNAKPGDVRFVDVNRDGTLDEEDRTMIGNPTPDFTFGFNTSLEYRQFDFSMLIVGAYGNDVFNGAQRQDLRYTNRSTKILDRWTGEGSSTTIPRYTWVDVNNNYRVSDLYIEDGSFMRIKNMQLGYSFNERILQRLKSHNFRVYVSVENLFTFTKYTGADPEIGAMSSFDVGIDRGIYPQARTIRFGTTVTF